jgi:hypothetical protein
MLNVFVLSVVAPCYMLEVNLKSYSHFQDIAPQVLRTPNQIELEATKTHIRYKSMVLPGWKRL